MPRVDYEAVFRAGATPYAVFTPALVIADVNDTFLAMVGRSREELVGVELFEAFPPDPDDEHGSEGPASLRASLLEVLRSAKPDVMDVQRYPLFDEGTASFQARYFTPINIPVFDERGEVGWIVHRVEEVTEYVTTRPATLSATGAETAAAALYARTRDLVRRNLELAIRAGHDREVSRILQEAMLTDLPEPDHLSLAARYVANTDTDQVGGDWYDAAVLPDGSTMIAVGDVVGHDINAAAGMGQLRALLRAVAWDRAEPPSAILTRVERSMAGLKVDTLATVILGRIEQAEADRASGVRRLRWSNAGHPPPILVGEDGTVAVLETRNDLLLGSGLRLDISRSDHVQELPPGSVLILYTDGLVERRDRPPEEGIRQLAEALRRHHRLPLGRLLDEIVIEVAGTAPDDDIAILAVSVTPETRSRPSQGEPG